MRCRWTADQPALAHHPPLAPSEKLPSCPHLPGPSHSCPLRKVSWPLPLYLPMNFQGFCALAGCRLLCSGLTVRSGQDTTVWSLSPLLHLSRSWGTRGGLDLRLDVWIQTQLCCLAAVWHWTSYLISLGSSFLICQMVVKIEVLNGVLILQGLSGLNKIVNQQTSKGLPWWPSG